jgi:hypothetical protein
MADTDRIDATSEQARIAQLEARVTALEFALARLNLAADPDPCVKTQKLAALPMETGPETRSTLDRLGITAAFATLDSRVAAMAEDERRSARPLAFDLPEIQIDPSLIDKAFARKPPEKIEVRADMEELHPRIIERLTGTWRTPELLQYLKRLIVDERGDRAGFSAAVMSELLMLSAVLEAPEEPDKWNANARVV